MQFHYDHNSRLAETQKKRDARKQYLSVTSGFGSTTTRFPFDTKTSSCNPGVGTYTLIPSHSTTLLLDSPSISKKGKGNGFASKTIKLKPVVDSGVPGPNAYKIQSIGESEKSINSNRPSTAFVSSGKGRVPFDPPKPVPGPSDYYINYDPGRSKILTNKTSATFASKSLRDSMYDVVSPAPPVGKYNVLESPKISVLVDFSKNANFVRFDHIGKDNEVPGPHRYFDDREVLEVKRKSLRTVGNYKGKLLGKLNERPSTVMHTFGADKDRFKNSVFGRLDLKALIPGPGTYDLAAPIYQSRPSTSNTTGTGLKAHRVQSPLRTVEKRMLKPDEPDRSRSISSSTRVESFSPQQNSRSQLGSGKFNNTSNSNFIQGPAYEQG
eukprot:gene8481-11464_t